MKLEKTKSKALLGFQVGANFEVGDEARCEWGELSEGGKLRYKLADLGWGRQRERQSPPVMSGSKLKRRKDARGPAFGLSQIRH